MSGGLEGLHIVVRIAHYAACIALFGEFVFALSIERMHAGRALQPRLRKVAAGWLVVVVLTGAAWLVVEAAVMSGLSWDAVFTGDTLQRVLARTLFGRVWIVRLGLAVLLAGLVLHATRRTPSRPMRFVAPSTVLAGLLLAALVLVGHANVEQGADRLVHRSADVVHLLAAGAWLGGLVPLTTTLARAYRASATAADVPVIATIVERFSLLGIACVVALGGTGMVNASYTVGSVTALTGSSYGALLSVKLGLFVAMVLLAAWNRSTLTPIIASPSTDLRARHRAIGRLGRNAAIEACIGLAIVAIVGVLGITMPAVRM